MVGAGDSDGRRLFRHPCGTDSGSLIGRPDSFLATTYESWSECDSGLSSKDFCFHVKAEVIQRHKALREVDWPTKEGGQMPPPSTSYLMAPTAT
jgi:hypothetical protein